MAETSERVGVIRALRLARKAQNEEVNFVRIIMRFPKTRDAFDRLRSIHALLCSNHHRRVPITELAEATADLFNAGRGAGRSPLDTGAVVRSLTLAAAYVGDAEEFDAEEFVVAAVLGLVLVEDDDAEEAPLGGTRGGGGDAFRVAVHDVLAAYLAFDAEGVGHFTEAEFRGYMSESRRADAARSFMTEERWAELDSMATGEVRFEAFVRAFARWVAVDDEEDDERGEEGADRGKNPLTPRVHLALRLSKSRLDQGKKGVNFTRIIMRFPKIHAVFARITSTHDKYDLNKDGHLQLQELSDAMNELMNKDADVGAIDFQTVENIFMLSDLDHHGLKDGLDVKNFIVFCAVGFILAEAGGENTATSITGEISAHDAEYRRAMMDIVGAYLMFDTEGKGHFTSHEMRAAVSDCGKKDAGSLLTPERWRELDIDNSGRVDFEEWVHAFSAWVNAGDDEDDENE